MLDEAFVKSLQRNAEQSKQLKLVRGDPDVASWIDGKYLKAALQANGLENYWTPLAANGKPQK